MYNLDTVSELPLYRLYILRASFLVLGVAQGSQTWYVIIRHAKHWDFWHGVGLCFLGALTALALLGVRYPVRMIPLMLFELAWKLLWALVVWLPQWLAHNVDPDTADNAFSIILGVVVVPLILPWGYVWRHYVIAPADRWR